MNNDTAIASALSRLDAVKDVMSVQRVFGEPTQIDGHARRGRARRRRRRWRRWVNA
jgi:hypothetical protein